jgi:hypothetical protein
MRLARDSENKAVCTDGVNTLTDTHSTQLPRLFQPSSRTKLILELEGAPLQLGVCTSFVRRTKSAVHKLREFGAVFVSHQTYLLPGLHQVACTSSYELVLALYKLL